MYVVSVFIPGRPYGSLETSVVEMEWDSEKASTPWFSLYVVVTSPRSYKNNQVVLAEFK